MIGRLRSCCAFKNLVWIVKRSNYVIKMPTRAIHVNNWMENWIFKFLKYRREWWPQRSYIFKWACNILAFEKHVVLR
jgi:hypothetical protein